METKHVELKKAKSSFLAKPPRAIQLCIIKDTLLDMCKASLKNHMKFMEELFAWDKKNEN